MSALKPGLTPKTSEHSVNRPTFEQAVQYVRTQQPPRPFTTNEKLNMYGLYKQATVGDAPQDPPGFWEGFETHAKWKVWSAYRGRSGDECKEAYIDSLVQLTSQ